MSFLVGISFSSGETMVAPWLRHPTELSIGEAQSSKYSPSSLPVGLCLYQPQSFPKALHFLLLHNRADSPYMDARSVVSGFLRPCGLEPTRLPLSMKFFRQNLKWLAISSFGDFPDPGIEPISPAFQEDF